jgi:hypothetical protein
LDVHGTPPDAHYLNRFLSRDPTHKNRVSIADLHHAYAKYSENMATAIYFTISTLH